ncbi:MAG: heavy-metal-associated domain-containing protein [Desulfovibrionaceae bacterium]|nr:heavy-metal-associated domain-containing protein [Desulfovibrionaceae bacterium]MBF0515090.1 heavy-metal-associated domain-containing protein [Desulfovibrionaceae bacterium]
MKTVPVKGMSCNHCVASVTKALAAVPGVASVSVSLEKGLATFEEKTPVDSELIRQAIIQIGFEPGQVA